MAKGNSPGVRGPGGPSGPERKPAPTPNHRSTLERVSYPYLVRLNRVPRWLIVILLASLLLAGFITPSWIGAILLGLLALFLAWLVALSWPVLKPSSRALRVITVVALAGIAVFRAQGRL